MLFISKFLLAQASYELPSSQFKYLEKRPIAFSELPIKVDHYGIDTATNQGGLFSIYLTGDLLEDAAIRENMVFTFTPTNRSDIAEIQLVPSKDDNLYFTEKMEDGTYEFYFEPAFAKAKISTSRTLDLKLSISYPIGPNIKEHSLKTGEKLVVVYSIPILSKVIKQIYMPDLLLNKTAVPNYFFSTSEFVGANTVKVRDLVAIRLDHDKVNEHTDKKDVSDHVVEKVWSKNFDDLSKDLKIKQSTATNVVNITAPIVYPADLEVNKRVLVAVATSSQDGYLMVYNTKGEIQDVTKFTTSTLRVPSVFRLHTFTADLNHVLISSYNADFKTNIFLHTWRGAGVGTNMSAFAAKTSNRFDKYRAGDVISIDYPGRITITNTSPNILSGGQYISAEYDLDGKFVFGLISHNNYATSTQKYHVKNQLPIYLINGYFDESSPRDNTAVPSSIYIMGRDQHIVEYDKAGQKKELYYPWLHDLKGTKATFYFVGLKPLGSGQPRLSNSRNADYNELVDAYRFTYDYNTGTANLRQVQQVAGNHYSWYELDSYTVLDNESKTRGVLYLCKECIIGKAKQILVERNNHLSNANIVDGNNLISANIPSQLAFHEGNVLFIGADPIDFWKPHSTIYYVNTTADDLIFDGYSSPYFEQSQSYKMMHRAVNAKYTTPGDLWKYPFYFSAVGNTKAIQSADDESPLSKITQHTQEAIMNSGLKTESAINIKNLTNTIQVKYKGKMTNSYFSQMTFYIQNLDAVEKDDASGEEVGHKIFPLTKSHNPSTNTITLTLTEADKNKLKSLVPKVNIWVYNVSHSDWALVMDFAGKKSYLSHFVNSTP